MNIISSNIRYIAFLLSLALTSNVYAYKLIPISAELTPVGKSSRQTFRIENPSEQPIAIEVNVFSREMNIDGRDILEPASNDFLIYPQQIIVMPGQSQAIRVEWKGNKSPNKELAYRLITEQLPINFDKKKSDGGQVTLLVKFIASLYIKPSNTHSDIKLVANNIIQEESGERFLQLTFKNNGKAHNLLRNPSLTISSPDKTVTLKKEDLKSLSNQNLLAEHSRQFILPWPESLPYRNIKTKFTFNQR